jgi:hypothetical protein
MTPHEIIALTFTAVMVGVAIGFAYAPTKAEPEPVDAAMEAYRDAAVFYCECLLAGFGSTTSWDKWRKAREVYLTESRED